ncbi:MAG TPA: bifunctional DNA-formamidopyrimidine glycosylase/DNA-(apurinic or apyrimidinic site) lyase [Candidatus Cloacimonadota bacterium]|nr:bifunctional DNA-formamidopyrimidine glycosylase/DNA-(apurinic or apyrimidinic site) lyase [Candidatus Cloacimonadota bacterium]
MPELPEVQTVLDGLSQAIRGRRILDIECYYPGTLRLAGNLPDPLYPRQAESFRRRGKYMIIGLSGGLSLIIHLRMTGKLVYDPTPGEVLAHERARIKLERDEAVHFIDIRTFGKLQLCRTDELGQYLPNLGVEPLEPGFTAEYLRDALSGKKAPIKNALLDQRIVAGLGNIYVCEALFRAGISPLRGSGSLKLKELKAIVKESRLVLAEALAVGGTSISDYRRIDDKTGEFQHFLQVYQKQECPKGHPLENIKQAGRGTWWCPLCQK